MLILEFGGVDIEGCRGLDQSIGCPGDHGNQALGLAFRLTLRLVLRLCLVVRSEDSRWVGSAAQHKTQTHPKPIFRQPLSEWKRAPGQVAEMVT